MQAWQAWFWDYPTVWHTSSLKIRVNGLVKKVVAITVAKQKQIPVFFFINLKNSCFGFQTITSLIGMERDILPLIKSTFEYSIESCFEFWFFIWRTDYWNNNEIKFAINEFINSLLGGTLELFWL